MGSPEEKKVNSGFFSAMSSSFSRFGIAMGRSVNGYVHICDMFVYMHVYGLLLFFY